MTKLTNFSTIRLFSITLILLVVSNTVFASEGQYFERRTKKKSKRYGSKRHSLEGADLVDLVPIMALDEDNMPSALPTIPPTQAPTLSSVPSGSSIPSLEPSTSSAPSTTTAPSGSPSLSTAPSVSSAPSLSASPSAEPTTSAEPSSAPSFIRYISCTRVRGNVRGKGKGKYKYFTTSAGGKGKGKGFATVSATTSKGKGKGIATVSAAASKGKGYKNVISRSTRAPKRV